MISTIITLSSSFGFKTTCGSFADEANWQSFRKNRSLKCLRPYHDENTRSRPITEVKHRRAGIVLGWGTAWELPVS